MATTEAKASEVGCSKSDVFNPLSLSLAASPPPSLLPVVWERDVYLGDPTRVELGNTFHWDTVAGVGS